MFILLLESIYQRQITKVSLSDNLIVSTIIYLFIYN